MNYSRLEKQIMADEGFEPRPYLDSVAVPTIGYGTTQLLSVPVTMNTPQITEKAARRLLRGDLFQALIDAQGLFVRFDEMDDVRQEVIVNMAYNLGKSRLGGFRKMIAAGHSLAYQRMADEMQDSKWFGQVGYRSIRLVAQMRTGEA